MRKKRNPTHPIKRGRKLENGEEGCPANGFYNSLMRPAHDKMELKAFEAMKNVFRDADVDEKIEMYVSAEGLTQTQYKELLRLFPLNALNRLEEALAA